MSWKVLSSVGVERLPVTVDLYVAVLDTTECVVTVDLCTDSDFVTCLTRTTEIWDFATDSFGIWQPLKRRRLQLLVRRRHWSRYSTYKLTTALGYISNVTVITIARYTVFLLRDPDKNFTIMWRLTLLLDNCCELNIDTMMRVNPNFITVYVALNCCGNWCKENINVFCRWLISGDWHGFSHLLTVAFNRLAPTFV